MEWYTVLAVIGVGLVAGFINTVAGGGSSLTLPLLMFLGLPANIANGTNRVAILLQSFVGVNTFRQKKIIDVRTDYKLTIPAVLGSVIGALTAVEINELLLGKIIGGLMVLMLFMVVAKPDVWLKERVGENHSNPSVFQYALFFLIGLYGGFIQMGVGFFLLAGLSAGCGYGLVKANAIKNLIIFIFTIFALSIFLMNGQVNIIAGLTLAAGQMAGAWAGAHFTIRGGAKYVRYVLIGSMLFVILELFGVFG